MRLAKETPDNDQWATESFDYIEMEEGKRKKVIDNLYLFV